MVFDTIFADCEGCFVDFIKENPMGLKDIKLIMFEVDSSDYKEIMQPGFEPLADFELVVCLRLLFFEYKVQDPCPAYEDGVSFVVLKRKQSGTAAALTQAAIDK